MIVPALALFSFSVVAQAAGVGGKPDLAAAAAKVVPKAGTAGQDDGVIVVVKNDDAGGLASALGRDHGKQVCWISGSQLARVSAAYRTVTGSLTVDGRTYTVVTVFDADEKALQRLLGVTPVECRVVHVAHTFFLPFDPNLS